MSKIKEALEAILYSGYLDGVVPQKLIDNARQAIAADLSEWDEAACLNAEIDIMVCQVFNAKSLPELKRIFEANFPKLWADERALQEALE